MRTTLYDTVNGKLFGGFREGPYLVDGRPGPLPYGIVELTVVETRDTFDPTTQYLVPNESVDVENAAYNIHYVATALPAGANVPYIVFARDLRLALIAGGVSMATIDGVIARPI